MDKVVHFEIPARDLERAKRFYSTVFGWRTSDWQGKPYTTVQTAETDDMGIVRENGAINGGIMIRNKNVPNPVILIEVADLGQSIKEIENAGGKVIVPKISGINKVCAYVRDTEGNVIGLIESKT